VSDFNETLIFWTDFLKILYISNFMKICPVEAEFHTDRWPDRRDEADGHVSQFIMYNGELHDEILTK
jgi:hypothetical protein